MSGPYLCQSWLDFSVFYLSVIVCFMLFKQLIICLLVLLKVFVSFQSPDGHVLQNHTYDG